MKTVNFKHLSILVFIDFIALSLFYYFTKYVIGTVKNYYEIIQKLTPEIDEIGSILQQNASLFEMNVLGGNLEIISQLSNKIILLFFLLGLISFLLYNISQSVNWNLALNEFKFKNFKFYLKRFTLINIPGFLILVYLFFKIIVILKTFILNYWFDNIFNFKEFFIILLLALISLAIVYIKFDLYKLINKHSLKDSFYLFKKRLTKEGFSFILFVITVTFSILLFIMILRIDPNSIILSMIASLVSLGIFNLFRIYLANKN